MTCGVHSDETVIALRPHPARGARRGADAWAPPDAARGDRTAARRGPLHLAAARLTRRAEGRADRPRGAGPDRRAGDGDAGPDPGRALEADRSLGGARADHVPHDGPQRPRVHGELYARGVRAPAREAGAPELPPAAGDGLSLPVERSRRGAAARRTLARARVRHEGRV